MGKSPPNPERSKRKIARLQARTARNPNSASLFQALGKAMLELSYLRPGGHCGDIETALRRSLELAPDDLWTHLYLANMCATLDQNHESLEAAKRAHELGPNIDMPLICMADAYAKLRDYGHADECFRKAVEVEPHSELARERLARWEAFWLPEQERRRNAKAEGRKRHDRSRDNADDS